MRTDRSVTTEVGLMSEFVSWRPDPFIKSYSRVTETYLRTRSDVTVNLPDSSGWQQPSPYVLSALARSSGAVSCEAVNKSNPGYRLAYLGYGGLITCAPPGGWSIPNSVKQEALVRAYKNLDSTKMDVALELIEMREAVSMIAKSANTLSRAMFGALRRDPLAVAKALGVKSVGKVGDTAGNLWLGYHFGWAPVVDAISSACVLLSDEKVHNKLRLVAKTAMVNQSSSTSSHTASVPSGQFSYTINSKLTVDEVYRLSLWYKLNVAELVKLNRFGLENPALLAWQLTPMSFVADWVLPIADVLQSWSASVGLTYLGGTGTEFWKGKLEATGSNPSVNSEYNVVSSDFSYPVLTGASMARTVFEVEPMVTPTYVKDPFSTWKAVTAVSLLKPFKSR